MSKLALVSKLLLVTLVLTACGGEAQTPTAIPPTTPPTATDPPSTATSPPATATTAPAMPTDQPSSPTSQPMATIAAAATATAEPSPTEPAATATAALAPGGWAMIEVSGGAPSPRYDHTAVIDPVGNTLVVFGGRDGSQTFRDTWIFNFDSSTWRQVADRGQEGPVARFGHGAVYDGANRRILMVMGQAGSQFFNDVWEFLLDEERWHLVKPHHVAEGEPRPRYGQSAALDKRGRVLISHGFSDQGRFDDTWAYDFGQEKWIDISPAPENRPLKRCLHELAYDPGTDRMYMYGGCASGFGPCPLGDLWAFDVEGRAWTELGQAGIDMPEPRSNMSFALNPDTGQIFVFGGLTEQGPSQGTWSYIIASGEWTGMESEISPPRRSSQGTGHDPQRRLVVIFGGKTPEGPSNDLWRTGF